MAIDVILMMLNMALNMVYDVILVLIAHDAGKLNVNFFSLKS